MVFHFAELDRFAPTEAREQVKAAFKGRSDVEFYLYPAATMPCGTGAIEL